jgi:hypothetical protein
MGKKVTIQDEEQELEHLRMLLDPKYAFDNIRPLQRPLKIPVMVSKPYPESNPGAYIEKDVSFLSDNEYFIDTQSNIYFRDPDTGKDVYLNKIDTLSYTHRTYATYILNDLSRYTNTVREPTTGRDTTVYARGGAVLFSDRPDVVAHRNRKYKDDKDDQNKFTYVDRIRFNLNREDGLPSNLYAILNTFRHEYIHVSDKREIEAYKEYRRKKLKGRFEYELNYIDHAEDVYKVQMMYEEFKKAPIDYQKNKLTTYVRFIIDGCKERGMKRAEDIWKRYFDEFNRVAGKKIDATITYDKADPRFFTIVLKGYAPCYVFMDSKKK